MEPGILGRFPSRIQTASGSMEEAPSYMLASQRRMQRTSGSSPHLWSSRPMSSPKPHRKVKVESECLFPQPHQWWVQERTVQNAARSISIPQLGDSQIPPSTCRMKSCSLMKSQCALYQESNARCRDLLIWIEMGFILPCYSSYFIPPPNLASRGFHEGEATLSLRVWVIDLKRGLN